MSDPQDPDGFRQATTEKARELAQHWYDRPESARDQDTLQFLIQDRLQEAWCAGHRTGFRRVRDKLLGLLGLDT